MTRLINTLGFGIATLMAIGAVFGAILTMYTAVASRAREIATLRALGFNTTFCRCIRSGRVLVLGAIGGIIGAIGAYLAFDGFQTSTMNFQTFSQVAFAFRVTPQLFVTGMVYALAIGFIGGLASRDSCREVADFASVEGIVGRYGLMCVSDSRPSSRSLLFSMHHHSISSSPGLMRTNTRVFLKGFA